MDVKMTAQADQQTNYAAKTSTPAITTDAANKTTAAKADNTVIQSNQTGEKAAVSNEMDKQEVESMTSELNKLMDKLNTDIRFSIHERTQRLIVQVISEKDQTVIREFPPKELLDTLANISDYIGIILDKKA